MKDAEHVKLLEQQLTIFAHEFHDRMDLEEGLRAQVEAARSVLLAHVTELRDVYLLHKKHVEETIEIVDMLRRLADQLELHVARGKATFKSPEGTTWYSAYKLLSKQSAKMLLRQKRELAPYLADDWKPPSADTWAGQVEQVVSDAEKEPAPAVATSAKNNAKPRQSVGDARSIGPDA